MQRVVLPLFGLIAFTGCADLGRSAYRDSNSVNKYARQNMMAIRRDTPPPPLYPHRIAAAAASSVPYPAGSPYAPGTGPHARLTADVQVPASSPGLYGPVQVSPAWQDNPGFGGRRYRYSSPGGYYGSYYPYGW